MRLSPAALCATALAIPLHAAEPAHVTVVAKDGRHSGALSVTHVEVEVNARAVKVPLAEIASVSFGDVDVVRTRRGRRHAGVVRVDGWTLQQPGAQKPLTRDQLQFFVPRIPLGAVRKGQIVDAAAANGVTYHVRVPEKYGAAGGAPAVVVLHGSNAHSADYVKGITQRWPKVAADYVLIGIDGEWPARKNPDGPPAYNYTYVNFVGKSKYKGFPGTDRESPALVAEVVAEIREQLKLTKVFVTGHSQGGFLAYSCLMNYPDVFAGGMPISAGLIFQCEPTAYEDAELRRRQRRLPIAIVHGDKDPLVAPSMATAAHESFLDGGFPMVRLLMAKNVGHPFIALPFEEGVRWMESMTTDDPKALLRFADQAFARRDYRDALAYLDRAKELQGDEPLGPAADALRKKIEQLAARDAEPLEAAIRANAGSGWVIDFAAFRRQFEFTEAAAGAMAEYAKLRKEHEPIAGKAWGEARKAFQAGNKEQGYRLCEQIINEHYASSFYRYATRTLAERK